MDRDTIATELLDALDARSIIEPITSRDASFDGLAAYEVSAEIH
jgi:hypothetical protein